MTTNAYLQIADIDMAIERQRGMVRMAMERQREDLIPGINSIIADLEAAKADITASLPGYARDTELANRSYLRTA